MTVQLTIFGLGQIGASIGLSLAKHKDKITRIGSDIDAGVMKQALKLGAVDKTTLNLNSAIRQADIVLLALPLDQIKEMIESIAPELKIGAVLMDTAPVKAAVTEWAGKALLPGCSYVGLTPALNPRYLQREEFGISAAKADLFDGSVFGIATPPHTDEKAIRLAIDLTSLMGAAPLFVDINEIDGLMAATHALPQLVSAALLNATIDQPGWGEARKVAGRGYAEATGPAAHLDDLQALVAMTDYNRENIVRKLNDTIAALQGLRDDIQQQDSAALETRLKHAKAGAHQWWQERGNGNWLAEEFPSAEHIPRSSDVMGNMLGFGLRRKKKKD